MDDHVNPEISPLARRPTHNGGNVKPATKRLLSILLHHSIKERGVDPMELLKEEPHTPNHEMTSEEKERLDKKRSKNRLHAKQSRDRRNLNFAKLEEEIRVMKKERKMLRNVVDWYYQKATRRKALWDTIVVQSSPSANKDFSSGLFHIRLPTDILDKLKADLTEPCKIERVLASVNKLLSAEIDRTGIQEEAYIKIMDEERETQLYDSTSVPGYPSISMDTSLCVTQAFEMIDPTDRPLPLHDNQSDTRGTDFNDSKVPINMINPACTNQQDNINTINPACTNQQDNINTINPACTNQQDNLKKEATDQSPWMVNSNSKESVFDVDFNGTGIGIKLNQTRKPVVKKNDAAHRYPSDKQNKLPIVDLKRKGRDLITTESTFQEENAQPHFLAQHDTTCPETWQNNTLTFRETPREFVMDLDDTSPLSGDCNITLSRSESIGSLALGGNLCAPISHYESFNYHMAEDFKVFSPNGSNISTFAPLTENNDGQYDQVNNLASLNVQDGDFEEFTSLEPSLTWL